MSPRKVLVVGLGVSGRAVCDLLLRRGVEVIATDLKTRSQLGPRCELLEKAGCVLRLGEHRVDDFLGVDQIVVSPGIPLDIEPLRLAFQRGIEIVGELDWAWRQVNLPVVAVTGTNGKTTTTSLIGEMFKASGKSTFVGGNIGTPLSAWLGNGAKSEVLVLEISSFQLDTANHFCPEVGILLNVTEDHLDRYPNFKAYEDSKFSLFSRQTRNHLAILNGDDPICCRRASEVGGLPLLFSRKDKTAHGTSDGRFIKIRIPGKSSFTLDLKSCVLKGVHNEENIMAAALAAAAMDVPVPAIQRALDEYRAHGHRLEWARCWRGIDFYDDSKATNVGAVVKALESFDRPLLLLLGGRDKLGSYEPLIEPLNGKCKGLFLFGEATPRLHKELGGMFPVSSHNNLEAAFHNAVRQAASGDVVLLSPACSSFDQYESYAMRGDHFKRLVSQLPAEP